MILSSLSPTLIELVLALSVTAPEVTAVTPDPIPIGATGQVVGSDFVDQATSVQIGGVAQRVVNVQPTQVTIVVDATTPEGAQTLTVTTPSGMVDHPVTIAPPNPMIDSLSPDPFVLGQRATLQGESLDTVTAVMLGGEPATISEQTEFLLQFEVPFEGALVGPQQLVLVSPTGGASASVLVVAPRPEIDAISPNPVRRGELITIRGQIAAVTVVTATIGQVDAPIVQVEPMAVTAFVPLTTTLGPQDVTVSVAQQASAPEGPLLIQREDPALPEVRGVYPSNVAVDGILWVVGSNLDGVTGATHGLEVVACERKACRLATGSAPVGVPFTAAVTGPAGAAIFSLQILDEAAVVPVVEGVSPMPAFRGETLTLTGPALGGVQSVVIGGRTQLITDFDASRVEVEVALDTPLGAEQLFVSGNSGSLPVLVTVLDPLPGEDTASDTVDGDTSGTGPTDTSQPTGGTSGGCSAAPGSAPSTWLLLLAAWLLAATWRRASAQAA